MIEMSICMSWTVISYCWPRMQKTDIVTEDNYIICNNLIRIARDQWLGHIWCQYPAADWIKWNRRVCAICVHSLHAYVCVFSGSVWKHRPVCVRAFCRFVLDACRLWSQGVKIYTVCVMKSTDFIHKLKWNFEVCFVYGNAVCHQRLLNRMCFSVSLNVWLCLIMLVNAWLCLIMLVWVRKN